MNFTFFSSTHRTFSRIDHILGHKSSLAAAAAAKLLQSCPTLCDPIDGSPPGSPVPGILQARTLAISFSNAWKWKVKVKSLSRVQLFASCSPPGSSVQEILQARILEWGAIAFSNLALVNSKKLFWILNWNHSKHLFWPQWSKIRCQLQEENY